MSQPSPVRSAVDRAGQVLPAVAVVALLLAGWFGWSAWQQYRDGRRLGAVEEVRDLAVQGAEDALVAAHRRFAERLASAGVRGALARGDLAQAAAQLTAGWKGAGEGRVQSSDLDEAYRKLAQPGGKGGSYGRLAALEAAIASGKPATWAVREGGARYIVLAATVTARNQPMVASVQLPLEDFVTGIQSPALPADAYIALRQGSATLAEHGDAALAGSGEFLAAKVPGSELRIAAAVPDTANGPFGLGAVGSLVAAALMLLFAGAAAAAPRWMARVRHEPDSHDGSDAPTLADVMRPAAMPPPPVPAKAVAVSTSLAVDRGIFRAYDIRGIVGQSLDAGVAELIGQAIGSVMQEQGLRDIVVGRDGRLSGPLMSESLITGLTRAGRNVIDIGLAPTPLTYFGAYHLRAGSCVSVTGSHNPPDYNGFKVVVGG
ncbi:MAG: phosphomannomutase/phosphoglucomutase, partial [Lysobacter sp.]